MGIRGLTSYVNALDELVWEDYELSNTTLVIDGSGLSYCVYANDKLDSRYGGQYSELEESIVSFFAKLNSNGVEPYVVFDGILDKSDKKLQTRKNRKDDRIGRAQRLWNHESEGDRSKMLSPLLTKSTLYKTLHLHGVHYAVADFEADHDIVSLANELGAPVMSLDSDYFIFDIKHGYIPFDHYDFSGSNMVKRFKRNKLAKHLNISPAMLPMLASLVGNDYVSDEILTCFKASSFGYPVKRGARCIPQIAEYLSAYGSSQEAMTAVINVSPESKRNHFKKAVSLSLEEYQIKPTHMVDYFTKGSLGSDLLTYNGHALPEWIIKLFRGGNFGTCISCLCRRRVFLKVQVEDMTEPSANRSTTQLRHHLYKLLMEYDNERFPLSEDRAMVVTEYDREHLSFVEHKTDLQELAIEAQISEIPTLRKDVASGYLFNALSCDMKLIRHLPHEWQLVAAAFRYWVTNATPAVTEEHLVALLVYCIGEEGLSEQSDIPGVVPHHVFAQWQLVIYWVDNLNLLFLSVYPSLHPGRLYNGLRVCKLYQKLLQDGIPAVEANVVDGRLYRQLYDAVVKHLPKECKK